LRCRKRDSNSRSLREEKGYEEPLQASIAISGLNLVSGSALRAAVSEWQERDRWFESGSLQQRVGHRPQQRVGEFTADRRADLRNLLDRRQPIEARCQ